MLSQIPEEPAGQRALGTARVQQQLGRRQIQRPPDAAAANLASSPPSSAAVANFPRNWILTAARRRHRSAQDQGLATFATSKDSLRQTVPRWCRGPVVRPLEAP